MLLKQASYLIGRKRQSEADRRRAVSAAYYALFHSVAKFGADWLVGSNPDLSGAYALAYRSLDHGTLKSGCMALVKQKPLTPLHIFASTLVDLQEDRHLADYAPEFSLDTESARAKIDRAADAISALKSADILDRHLFLSELYFKKRK
ncbi:MAG: hypothetical protein HXY25_06415 [Alphaproteobacteria bacterium]|nr:hypothetical protein [Alphaproteobacteria bacterium]